MKIFYSTFSEAISYNFCLLKQQTLPCTNEELKLAFGVVLQHVIQSNKDVNRSPRTDGGPVDASDATLGERRFLIKDLLVLLQQPQTVELIGTNFNDIVIGFLQNVCEDDDTDDTQHLTYAPCFDPQVLGKFILVVFDLIQQIMDMYEDSQPTTDSSSTEY